MSRFIEFIVSGLILYIVIIIFNFGLCLNLFTSSYKQLEQCNMHSIEYDMWNAYCVDIVNTISSCPKMLTGISYIPLRLESPAKYIDNP